MNKLKKFIKCNILGIVTMFSYLYIFSIVFVKLIDGFFGYTGTFTEGFLCYLFIGWVVNGSIELFKKLKQEYNNG